MAGYERARLNDRESHGWIARAVLVTLGFATAITVALILAASGLTSESSASNEAPAARKADTLPIAVPMGRDSVTAFPRPAPAPVMPYATKTVRLYAGPDDNYAVVGTLAAGADLEIVGRSEAGDWIAVVFPPLSLFTAWLPADLVEGIEAGDIAALDIAPVKPLSRR